MIAMWQRLGDYFGPQWEASYGNADGGTIYAWTGALNRYTETELAGAIKACADWDGKFPPTFPEFKALAMAARSAAKPNYTEKRMEMEKASGKSMPMLEHLARSANSEIAKRELDRMRRIMAGEDVESFDVSYHNCGLGKRWPGKAA